MMPTTLDAASVRLLPVEVKQPLKALLRIHSIPFHAGAAYYQLRKRELVQHYKHVVVMKKGTRQFVTGSAVKAVLKLPVGVTEKFFLDAAEIPDFAVFVQSTSHNRVVHPGMSVLVQTGSDIPAASDPASPPAPARRVTRSRAAVGRDPADSVASSPAPCPPAAPTRVSARTKRTIAPPAAGVVAPFPAKRLSRAVAKRVKRAVKTPAVPSKAPAGRAARAVPVGGKRKASEMSKATAAFPVAHKSSKTVPSAGGVGGDAMAHDVVFTFDTTGSMYPCLSAVRTHLRTMIPTLLARIPSLRVALMAHGDYCDAADTYVTSICDFDDDVDTLCAFTRDVGPTCGGDFEECYELVLHEARTRLSWRSGSKRSVVVIGDATPHAVGYPLNAQRLDWKVEAAKLKEHGVKIYAVQAMDWSISTPFYRAMADLSGGFFLKLDQFSSLPSFMLAICYHQTDGSVLEEYESQLREQHSLNRELHRLFDTLAQRSTPFASAAVPGASSTGALTPVSPSRFQVLSVDESYSIRAFCEAHHLSFAPGRGFYEFTKPEKISGKKEVVLIEKTTGDMFTGREAADMVGAGGAERIRPVSLKQFRVFVQSTSYNRVLMPGTGFLYEA